MNNQKKGKKEEKKKKGPTQQLRDRRARGKTGQSGAERMKEPQGEGRSLWGLWGRRCEFDKGHDETPKTNPLQKCKLIRLMSTSVVIHTCPRAESPLTRSSAYWGCAGSKILIRKINQCFVYFYNTSFFLKNTKQKKKMGAGAPIEAHRWYQHTSIPLNSERGKSIDSLIYMLFKYHAMSV